MKSEEIQAIRARARVGDDLVVTRAEDGSILQWELVRYDQPISKVEVYRIGATPVGEAEAIEVSR